MKRLLIALVAAAVGVAAVVGWLGRAEVTRRAHAELERQLSLALHVPVRIGTLSLSMAPLSLRATDIAVGADPPLAQVGGLTVRAAPWTSLRSGRLVLSARIDAPRVDLSLLPHEDEPPGKAAPAAFGPLLPVAVKSLRIADARLRFRLGKDLAEVSVDGLEGALRTSPLRASVAIRLAAFGAEIRRKQYGMRIDELNATGGLDADGVFVNRATARGDGLSLDVRGTDGSHEHEGGAELRAALLGTFVDELGLIDGTLHLKGALRGNVIDPVVDIHIDAPKVGLAGRTLGDLSTRMRRNGPMLLFDDVSLRSATGSARGNVQLRAVDEVPIRADLEWRDVALRELLEKIGPRIPFHDLLAGTTSLEGFLDPLDLRIDGRGTAQGTDSAERASARWAAKTHVIKDGFRGEAEITQEAGNRVAATIDIRDNAFGGEARVSAADLRPLNAFIPDPVPLLGLSGRGEATVAFSGTVTDPVVEGSLTLRDARILDTAVPALDGSFSVREHVLAGKAVRLVAAGGSAELDGTLALADDAENDFALRLDTMDGDFLLSLLGRVAKVNLPAKGGKISATTRCRGPWARAALEGTLSAAGIEVLGEPLQRLEVSATAALPAWTLRARAEHGVGEVVTVDGSGQGGARLLIGVESTAIRLAGLRALADKGVDGTVAVRARLEGAAARPGGSLHVDAAGLSAGDRPIGDAAVDAAGKDGAWTFRGTAVDRHLGFDGSLRLEPALPLTVSAHWQDLDITKLLGRPADLEARTGGSFELAGSAADPRTLRGPIRVTEFGAEHGPYRVRLAEAARLRLEGGVLHLDSALLDAPDGRLSLRGEAAADGRIDLDADGSGDLVLLELLGLPVSALRGPFNVAAHVRHSAAAGWELSGDVAVRDAVFDFGLPVALRKTNARLRLAGQRVRIEEFSARAGSGTLGLGGSVDLGAGPDIEWTLDDVPFSLPQGIEARVKGRGSVRGRWDQVTVGGGIEVLNALYDDDIDMRDILPLLLAQLRPKPAPKLEEYRGPNLDLLIYSSGGVFIDNNLASVEMWLNLQLSGNAQSPVLSGEIGFLNGRVVVQGRQFVITAGTIDFRDRFRNNPVLNISAENRVSTPDGEYEVTAVVTGTAEKPRVQFSANDPTLTQSDVVNLATFGKTTAQLQQEGGGIGPGDALALLPTGLVKKGLSPLLVVDQFEIETIQSRTTGTLEPRLTIGKQLTENLRATLSTTFNADVRRNVQLEYRLTRRISLLGSWESQTQSEAGALGADIKFRQEFRRLPFSLLNRAIAPTVPPAAKPMPPTEGGS